jgi:mRNA interferase RelE/StbE
MTWQVIWSEKSVKQLKKIDKTNARKIRDVILEARYNPHQAVTRLTDSPFFRLRVGDYRVILDLQQNKMIIFVIEMDHRKKIYKK